MKYKNKRDLPPTIADVLPENAQEVYLDAYNRGWDEYDEASSEGLSRHGLAHRRGWGVMEREFAQDPDTGTWRRKDAKALAEDKSLLGKVKNAIENIFS